MGQAILQWLADVFGCMQARARASHFSTRSCAYKGVTQWAGVPLTQSPPRPQLLKSLMPNTWPEGLTDKLRIAIDRHCMLIAPQVPHRSLCSALTALTL